MTVSFNPKRTKNINYFYVPKIFSSLDTRVALKPKSLKPFATLFIFKILIPIPWWTRNNILSRQ